MKYSRIPNTDLEVSALCLGTWVLGGDVWGGANEKESLEAVQAALEGGINFIDTAPIYGDGLAEKIVGKAIKGKRQKVVLATKCGLVKQGKEIRIDLGPSSIRREVEQSLERLGVEQIDLYQCHWPDLNTPIEMTLEALVRIKEEGKIKYIGVSNFTDELLKRAAGFTEIATVQCQYSLLERWVEDALLPFCQEKGIGFLAYGPLGGGILSGKYRSPKPFAKNDARNFFYRFYEDEGFDRAKKLISQLKKLGRPLHEAALNWVRQQPGVTSVLIGCRNVKQVKANLRSLNWVFSAQELEPFHSVGRKI